ncbi:MAG: family 10 glycosylhydrolase [Planctomycetota bacterium]|nr:family 10 glycosylhydrolase [Planctomycetota bacterium]
MLKPAAVFAVLFVLLATAAAHAAETASVFAAADEPSARAAWQPMEGTAPVTVAVADGVKAVRMPCNFSGTKFERASWDRKVQLDLSDCRGLTFKMFCRDASPVSHFVLYLQSGGGWYTASFGPSEKGKWCTVAIDKDEMHIEGKPAGWEAIQTIRLSAWRGGNADTEFYVSDFALAGEGARIAIIRGESAARNAPSEVESVVQFTGAIARNLRDLGLEYTVINDLDLSAARLKKYALVVLPHNPAMPDAAAEAIAKFVEGGGKVIAFYGVHDKLRGVLGLTGGGHVSQKFPGQFASMHFGPELAGAPAEVGQQSWNIVDLRPVEGKSRVAAEWFDKDGKDTGYPAVIVSDNGIYMSHVLLPDDAANKRRMLLAMVDNFIPEAWKQAVGAVIAKIGRLGPYNGYAEAFAGIDSLSKGNGPARIALTWAKQYHDEATMGGGYSAIESAENSRLQMIAAWSAVQKSFPGEFRAIWCHSAFGPQGMNWDEAIKALADNGFTAVLPNMLWGGTAFYESTVLPVAPEVKEKGDQIAACLAACKKYGVQCHVWKVNWNMSGRAPREFVERMKIVGRTQVSESGKPQATWLCPSHPDNQKLEIDSMVEVATKYEVDGIHFDYIRYPDEGYCYCPGCRERFEKAVGAKIVNWPADLRKDETLRAKWLDFRRDNITRVVAAVSEQVRKARPKVKISAAVFPNWAVDRDKIGQDWKLWCDRGYLDFVCPMDYTPQTGAFENLVTTQLPLAGKVPCYPGIGLSTWNPPTDACKVIDQITAARQAGCKGFTIFELNGATVREVLPMLGKGITRRE